MDLFAFPTEIRLKIYSHGLVRSAPIDFWVRRRRRSLALLRTFKIDLCPTLLATSKQVYEESIGFLYSDNCFRFNDMPKYFEELNVPGAKPCIQLFLCQIGARSSLLRHVAVTFPTPLGYGPRPDQPHPRHLRTLDLLRYVCTNVRTFELVLPLGAARSVLDVSPGTPAELLDLISTYLKALPSLREVVVDIRVPDEDPEELGPFEDLDGDGWQEISDDEWDAEDRLRQKLLARGWAVRMTRVQPKNMTWDNWVMGIQLRRRRNY